MTTQEIVIMSNAPSIIPDEIIIIKHINGWTFYPSESISQVFLPIDELLRIKYNIKVPSDILELIDSEVQESFNTLKIIKSAFYIVLNNKSYPFEITVIPATKQLVTIILRRTVEWEIQDNSTKYAVLFKQNKIGLIILDLNLNIKDINDLACDLLDRHKSHIENKSLFEFLDPEDIKKLKRYMVLSDIIKKYCPSMDLRIIKRNGEVTWISFSISVVSEVDSTNFQYVVVINDITEQKKIEYERKKEKMRFELEDGKLYWIDELSANLCYSVFDDYLSLDYQGLIYSRASEDNLRSFIAKDFDYFYLGKTDPYEIDLNILHHIRETFLSLSKKSIVLFDEIDYFLIHHDIDLIPIIFHFLKDIALFKDMIILVTVNKQRIGEGNWAILEKEGIELNLFDKRNLSNDDIEILRFIQQQNLARLKPIFSDVCKNQNITKPTCKKVIEALVQNKLLIVEKKGKMKHLIVTETGIKLIH